MSGAQGGFRCDVAMGADIERAIAVRRLVYIDEFGFAFGGGGPRDSFDDRAYHLLATTAADEPVGSLRFLDAPARPFEIEEFLDITSLLPADRHPAEITRLCILAEYRKISKAAFVHLSMFEAVMRLAHGLGVTDIVASTRADLKSFYAYLLFETYESSVYRHPGIGDAVHTLMRLDLTTVAERYRRTRPTLYRAFAAALRDVAH
jgi:N-acyl-L-homoserine lactone synthetase